MTEDQSAREPVESPATEQSDDAEPTATATATGEGAEATATVDSSDHDTTADDGADDDEGRARE